MSRLPNSPKAGEVPIPLENLPDVPPSSLVVLAASPLAEDHIALQGIFGHSRWEFYSARTFQQALSMLTDNRIGVVLSECSFPDGHTWKSLLSEIEKMANPPPLVVTSRLADDSLWAEVLNLGGYDLLLKPFDATEVFRVVSMAWGQ
jgi:DNA-binding response OmpR family regulator